jgi:hypothetical protein
MGGLKMSALYAMRYSGGGASAIYIGKGTIVGIGTKNGRYNGTYSEEGGRMKVNMTLLMPSGGAFVSGQSVPVGGLVQITADWPANFADGQPHQIIVQGRPIQVTFEKIGDVP